MSSKSSRRSSSRSSTTDQTVNLTMAQALVRFLSVQFSERDGVTRRMIPAIIGIFGHGNVAGLGQALWEYGEYLPYHQARNEQSMVHTAIGFAKTNLRKATLACTSSIGPGATNMLTGAATATLNRLPVLLLPSDYYATRYQGPVLQQLEHPVSADVSVNDAFRPLSRYFDRITRPEQLLASLPEAMRVLTSPAETGAVTIALPQDVQSHAYLYPTSLFEPRVWPIERRMPNAQRVEEAISLLKRAQRPLIVAGGGVHYSEAWDELQSFAESCGIPVVETFAGKGSIRRPSPMLLGGGGVTGTEASGKLESTADVVICIGTRLSDFTTGSHSAFGNPEVCFIHLNVMERDAAKLSALPLVGDARDGLRMLHARARAADLKPRRAYQREIAAARAAWETRLAEEVFVRRPSEALSQGELIGILNDEAQAGDVVISAAGSAPGDMMKLWNADGERHCHIEFGNSCMGYELPAGLGVRMAGARGEVYVFIGDGTYLMNPTELVTALQEDLKVTVVLADNHGFQVIRSLQMNRAGRSFGNEFRRRDKRVNRLEGDYLQIDFAANAKSMGARAWHVHTEDELRRALGEARAESRSCVIVVEVEKHRTLPGSGLWWDVAPAETSGDVETRRRRRAYVAERKRLQRYYG